MTHVKKIVFAHGKKIVFAVLLILAVAAPLSACNTIEGIGKDATAAGDAISGAASTSKGY